MLNRILDLLESVIELEKGTRSGWRKGNLQNLMLNIQHILKETPDLRSRYSRTITAISADLGIAPEKPGSLHTPDTSVEKTGGDSSKEASFLAKE